MPIYEYECAACRQRFEKLQSFSDEPIRVCPHCGGDTRRVLQPVGVIFKGSGWYVTDSRKSTASNSGSSNNSSSGPGGSGEAGKTESSSSPASESGSSPSTGSTPAAAPSTDD